VLGAVAALAAALVLVVGLRAVTPPRPPEAPKVVGGFHIDVQPYQAVAAGGFVIVADERGQLLQIDPRTTEKRHTIATGDGVPVSVAEDGAAVWTVTVHNAPGRPRSTLLKLDSKSGRRLDEVKLAGESGSLAVGAGGIWVLSNVTTELSAHPGGLQRIDPVTHRRTAITEDVHAQSVAASDRSVWTRDGETVTQRDDRGRIVNRVRHISPEVGLEGEQSIVADSDGAWVVGQSDGLLYRIENGRVAKRIRIGQLGGAIARSRSAVWVTAMVSAGHFELVRVDPDDGNVTGRVAIGGDEPQTIVPIGKQVWVITGGGDVIRVSQG
jgi:hypothetical protein